MEGPVAGDERGPLGTRDLPEGVFDCLVGEARVQAPEGPAQNAREDDVVQAVPPALPRVRQEVDARSHLPPERAEPGEGGLFNDRLREEGAHGAAQLFVDSGCLGTSHTSKATSRSLAWRSTIASSLQVSNSGSFATA